MQLTANENRLSPTRADLIATPSNKNKVRPFSQNGREQGRKDLDKSFVKMDVITEANKLEKKNPDANDAANQMPVLAIKPALPLALSSSTIVKEEQIIPKKKVTRDEHFFCLCKKCNSRYKCETHPCKICFNTLCGYPMHTCTLFFAAFLALIVLFSYYLYVFLIFKYANNSYFATCLSNIDCNSTIGLYCATTAGVCNCPAKNTVGRCDCNKGYYWNGTQCSLLLTYNSTGCVNNYNCDQSKNLVCSGYVCGCEKPKVWTNSTCDYNYIGCFIDISTLNGPLWSSQNNNSRMTYVVETCVGYCYNIKIKYALLSISNYVVGCYCQGKIINSRFIKLLIFKIFMCQANYTTISSTSCNTLCPGSNSVGYYCGNSGYTNQSIKSVYQTF